MFLPLLTLGCGVPMLVAFNLAQNAHWASDAATFVERRDRAAPPNSRLAGSAVFELACRSL